MIVGLLCLYSCNQLSTHERPERIRSFNTTQWLEEIESYGGLRRLGQLQFYNDRLYLSATESHQIVCVDRDFKLLHTIGAPGTGPGEFQMPSYFRLSDQMLMVYSEGPQQIHLFSDSGEYEHRLNVGMIATAFAYHKGNFFISDPQQEMPIKVIDMDGGEIKLFGEPFASDHPRERRARGYRHLEIIVLDGHDFLLAVSLTEPTIELFDLEGNLILEKDVGHLQILKPRIDFQAEEYAADSINRQSSYTLFQSTSVHEDRLYVQPYLTGDYGYIFVFKVSLEAIELDHLIKIPFIIENLSVVSPDQFYAFDYRYGILHRFEPERDK